MHDNSVDWADDRKPNLRFRVCSNDADMRDMTYQQLKNRSYNIV